MLQLIDGWSFKVEQKNEQTTEVGIAYNGLGYYWCGGGGILTINKCYLKKIKPEHVPIQPRQVLV